MTQYSGVYTLQTQGQAITSGQWATDPYYKNTTLLLHADGVPGGAQNNTFLDSSTNAFAVTRNGNTTQGSFTPYGPTWSNYFSGNYLQTPASSASTIVGTMGGSTNLTIECWIFPSSYNTTAFPAIIGDMNPTVEADYWSWGIDASGYLKIYWYDGGSGKTCSSSGAVSLNAWTHIALNINAGAMTMYINGVSQTLSGTTTLTSVAGSLGYLAIGLWNNGTGGTGGVSNGKFTGYISNLRVIKASTYTTSFIPSTSPLTAVTNTSLLTCQSNRFVDNSVNSLALTVSGASVQRFSPFAPQYQYTPAVIGGSGYFDGTGDYLALSNVTALQPGSSSTAFSIECWIYPTTQTGTNTAVWGNYTVTSYPTNTNGCDLLFATGNTVAFRWGYPNYADSGNSSALALNSWNHVVVCRNSSGSLSCYLNGTRWFNTSSNTSITAATAASFWVGWAGSLSGTTINPFLGNIAGFSFVKGATTYDPTLSTITVPTSPPTSSANTALLCNFTNAGIYDNAMMNDLETVGNAQVSTSVFKYGSGSLYFDGSGDYLSSTPQAGQFGTGDFTVEAWVNTSSTATENIASLNNYNSNGWALGVNYPSSGSFFWYSNTTTVVSASGVALNTWYHVAVCRSNGVLSLFVNGVLRATAANTTNYSASSSLLVGNDMSNQYFTGYIDDLRITSGVARYTGNFIPPKVAFANQ